MSYEKLISWLKYFDIEYLSYEEAARLSDLDVNDPNQRYIAIELALHKEFTELNPVSRLSMLHILEHSLSASEEQLESVFSRVGMPFLAELHSKREFLQEINRVVNGFHV